MQKNDWALSKKIPEGTLEIKLIMLKIISQVSEGRLISRHI